ncbi:PREDICTED: uncharacterized protein LOC104740892 [Camelina sativa]|uniref:Uncharacterized protein LOC104740892 n=1 Tax=Camelina sativa TaxID=90675 RepID=A0ABM0VR47_CAMSA|nr:PREDICTED: uncharacterized protein LOC104740892 [Camelina sativa]
MNGGGVVNETREATRDEEREEVLRMASRFVVAGLLDLLTGVCKQVARPGPNPTTYSWALEFNLWAHLSFTFVVYRILCAPQVLESMKKIRVECDAQLLLGVVCLIATSLLFFAC